jgi:hypothetical protein
MLVKKYGIALLILITAVMSFMGQQNALVVNAGSTAIETKPRVNIPYSAPGAPYPSHAIFWLGKVDRDHNYSDVRIIYYDSRIKFTIHTIDRLLWTDTSPTPAEIKEWDAISVYLNTDALSPSTPHTTSYRFDVQLGGHHAIYQGDGTKWVEVNIPTEITTSWRGDQGPNSNVDAKGWQADIYIPFTSFGLSSTPPFNSIWGLAVEMHDRDDAAGAIRFTKSWPSSMQPNNPSSWGELSFGWKPVDFPSALPTGKTTLRHGLNNISVRDGHVGGHTICGSNVDHWTEWGNTNYAGYGQINIQNQWDVSDWPCFSKFFITFPLDTLPNDKTIISAKLTMTLFGTSGGGEWGEPPDSYIQVFSVSDDWDESTLTWNNAPAAKENISGTWVKPRNYELPYETYSWEVREAVVEAIQSGQPLRLALYSADGPMHTGKYFWSSDTTEWGGAVRPTLEIVWGEDCSSPDITCHFQYIPNVLK